MKKYLIPIMLVGIMIGCQSEKNIRVLKLAHVLDITHPVHKGMVFMAEKVSEKSGGRMRIDIYPGGQLGANSRNQGMKPSVQAPSSSQWVPSPR